MPFIQESPRTCSRRVRDRISAICLAAVFSLGLATTGCESDADRVAIEQSPEEIAEEELQWSMERLERALKMQEDSPSMGLRFKRTLDYEFLPPEKKGGPIRGEVSITSVTIFHHQQFTGDPDTKQPTEEEPKRSVAEQVLDDPTGIRDEYADEMVNIPGVGPKAPAAPEARIKPRRKKETKVFGMTYTDGSWQLDDEPEEEYERLWFEYALSI